MTRIIEGRVTDVDQCKECNGSGIIFKAVFGTGQLLEAGKCYRLKQECDKCYGEGFTVDTEQGKSNGK